MHESRQQAAIAKKTVTTGPEQGYERTREMGGLKSPALVVLEATLFPVRTINLCWGAIQNGIETSGDGDSACAAVNSKVTARVALADNSRVTVRVLPARL